MKRNRLLAVAGLGLLAMSPLLLALRGCPRPAPDQARPARPMDEALFTRDQPQIRRLVSWDGRVVVQADRLYALDLERASVSPLAVPGTGKVVEVATCGGRAVALCEVDDGLRLLGKQGNKWEDLGLPPEAARVVAAPTLRADRSSLVLLGEDTLFTLAAGGWRRLPLKPRPRVTILPASQAQHVLLAGGKLYLGHDQGEWGGGLLALDVETGAWEEVRLGDRGGRPVTGLRVGPGGTVWVTEGLSHLGLVEGSLHRNDRKGWRLVCDSSERGGRDWDLPPASLDAVAFDGEGRLYLLSGELGVVRREGAGWERLTPGWPSHAYASCLHVAPSGLLVIGLSDGGVLLVDPDTQGARRVALR
jgi:hypothetical protein